ncbi:acyl carrier protein [Streptomyces sp. SL13]|uniref:Acyl carrier protein n=1 Tax=Streptantibioticus silvisoli TaxID=2705255 RepID=A0AA90H2W8_9ACTN|nr:acyl carrier protein [Streptantibioticus silvisoli]MDI5961244.1 acyl carrier protein [Streptantibioticus silvisoli]MDI5971046.1 acyl carrier protein [Streptantibioticus silvisoli]
MSLLPPFDRAAVIGMLAAFGDRDPSAVDEEIGSLELTWLVTEVEQRYGITVELPEDALDAVWTVDDAVRVLGALLPAAAAPAEGR